MAQNEEDYSAYWLSRMQGAQSPYLPYNNVANYQAQQSAIQQHKLAALLGAQGLGNYAIGTGGIYNPVPSLTPEPEDEFGWLCRRVSEVSWKS